ncbi:LADA_0F07294g1_1 [Lachancea dasiensis]|uniref:LADA_0F07294g1_1 n=1 Tax=Lachancea dasiensis TaxID=1072105 RepID=A0A1G4JKE9_9SACH|nr:LADA_0F07294g1_1 [Lachancea dasiensis]
MTFLKKSHLSDKKSTSTSSKDVTEGNVRNEGLVELLIDVESPPCVLYGPPMESTGTLLSGLLKLRVRHPDDVIANSEPLTPVSSHGHKKKSVHSLNSLSQTLSSLSIKNSSASPSASPKLPRTPPSFKYSEIAVQGVSLSLIQRVQYAKPFVAELSAVQSCKDCCSKVTELARWDVVVKETKIPIGDHVYPFSHLIPGSVPVTVSLGSDSKTEVKYELVAEATYKPVIGKDNNVNSKNRAILRLPVPITRSILRGPDRNSMRIFPPTDLVVTAVLPNIIYPKSTFPLELKLDGISSEGRRWRMRRLNWKLEERGRVRLNTCNVHKSKLKSLEKDVAASQTRKNSAKGKPSKRTHDAAPQVTTSVCTLEEAFSITRAPEDANVPQNAATNEEESTNDANSLVHPSDDAMRQEILAEQERMRNEIVQQDLSQETALFTEEVRTIAHGEVKSGWKSDFSGQGKVEMVTELNCMGLNSGVSNPVTRGSSLHSMADHSKQPVTVACDVEDSHLGIYVQHLLILEVIVAEEMLQYANGQPLHPGHGTGSNSSGLTPTASSDQRLAEVSPILAARNTQSIPTDSQNDDNLTPVVSQGNSKVSAAQRIVGLPTGAARVLRMQFRQVITERSGLGISWDDEVPPTYQDIRLLSPPSYSKAMSKKDTSLTQAAKTDNLDDLEDRIDRVDLQMPLPPPQAHSHGDSDQHLTPAQSPLLNHIVSIQGNAGPSHVLTPMNTQEIRMPALSELLDTDRITQ